MKYTCAICLKSNYSFFPYKNPCGHKIHKKCMKEWLNRNNTCPICIAPVFDYQGKYKNQLIHININSIKDAISFTQKFGGKEISRLYYKNISKFEVNKKQLVFYEAVSNSNTSHMEIRHIIDTPNAMKIFNQLYYRCLVLSNSI